MQTSLGFGFANFPSTRSCTVVKKKEETLGKATRVLTNVNKAKIKPSRGFRVIKWEKLSRSPPRIPK